MTPPDFGRSVNPISTWETDYALLITTGTPGFSDLPTALLWSQPKHANPARKGRVEMAKLPVCTQIMQTDDL